jgi:hypothetical protein
LPEGATIAALASITASAVRQADWCHGLADQAHPGRCAKLLDQSPLKPDCCGQPEKTPKIAGNNAIKEA